MWQNTFSPPCPWIIQNGRHYPNIKPEKTKMYKIHLSASLTKSQQMQIELQILMPMLILPDQRQKRHPQKTRCCCNPFPQCIFFLYLWRLVPFSWQNLLPRMLPLLRCDTEYGCWGWGDWWVTLQFPAYFCYQLRIIKNG